MPRRPLVWLAAAWIGGILIAHQLGETLPTLAWWLAGCFSLLLLLIGYRRKLHWWPLIPLALAALLGALSYAQSLLPLAALQAQLHSLQRVRGLIVNYPSQRPDISSFVLKLSDYPGSFQVFYHHNSNKQTQYFKAPAYGYRLELSGQFKLPWSSEDFDYRTYLWSRDIWAIASVWSSEQLKVQAPRQGNRLLAWGYRTRLRLFALIDRYFSPRSGGLLKALLLGERAYLNPDIKQGFRDAGVMHVLAVSGLHLGIIIGLLWMLLRALRLSISATYLSLLPLVLLYLVLVGFKVSLVRASLLFVFIALGAVLAERGIILRRWADPLQGLAAAALLMLIMNPKALFDVGFQLSFAATTGILLALRWALPRWQRCAPQLKERWGTSESLLKRLLFKLGEALLFSLLVSTAAQLAVAPFLAYQFHRIYLASFLINLAIVPLATWVIWGGLGFLGLAALPLAFLAQGAAALETLLLQLLIGLTERFAALPWSYLLVSRAALLGALVLLPLLLSPLAWSIGWLTLLRLRGR
ncbi:MAG TPA: ComEC family competence protein [Candidatus Fraserbacteria bacterium]|nr:ComEC family competence protein [Candidatus Fraserbacteria bacterium]